MPPPRSSLSARANTSTWRSPAGTIRVRASCSSTRRSGTGGWCRWGPNDAPARAPSRPSRRSGRASSGCRTAAVPGTPTLGGRSGAAGRRRSPPCSTTSCGRDLRRARRIRTTSSTTTGTGSGAGAPARSATTGRTRSTSPAGRWAWTTPRASSRSAVATTSRTTGSSRTPRRSASSSEGRRRSCGKDSPATASRPRTARAARASRAPQAAWSWTRTVTPYTISRTRSSRKRWLRRAATRSPRVATTSSRPCTSRTSWTPSAPARRCASRSRRGRSRCCSAVSGTSRSGPGARSASIPGPDAFRGTTKRWAIGSGSTPRAGRRPCRNVAAVLERDRFFDPDPAVRRVARDLYDETRPLPIVSPHGHVEPRILARDEPFAEPAALIVQPDHYILRMLYARGVPLEALGVPRRDGTPVEADPCKVWQAFAEHYHLFLGTPTGYWLDYELHEVFGVRERLSAETAPMVYDEIAEKLSSPEFRPRALFERFNIEVLATTDRASDPLDHHRVIRESGWGGRVIPCFRPDAVLRIAAPGWPAELEALGREHGTPLVDYPELVRALEDRRKFFKRMGATATDHAVLEPYTTWLPPDEAEVLFQRARHGEATPTDERRLQGHLLIEMARMRSEE